MTGVPRSIAEHSLNISLAQTPFVQKKRSLASKRSQAVANEVNKLVSTDILKEVKYHTWVANSVMVKKSDESWRICVDFKDLNKACPKDFYPLPEIDLKVDSLTGFNLKCFLDAYKGYHQIKMSRADEENTAFHTTKGIFCYKKMPFGLKNAGATYQRLIDKAFEGQLDKNMEAYVDDLVIKSQSEEDMIKDIDFLGHLVNKREIRANPDKVKTVRDMKLPRSRKDVQSLNAPRKGEQLYLYIAVRQEAVSAVLVTNRAGSRLPFYFMERQTWRDPRPASYTHYTDPEGKEITYALHLNFPSTNNEAEYEAFLAGLRMARKMGAKYLKVHVDSLLVASQVNGEYAAKEPSMQKYKEKAKQLMKGFNRCTVIQVSRTQNKRVDALRKLVSLTFAHLTKKVLVEPAMHKDTIKEIRKCKSYQLHAPVTHVPRYNLVTIKSAWPFFKWGMDIVGPFPEGACKAKFLLVAVDYFTKWPEVKPLASITGKQMIIFFWENIICQFGLPGELVTDNGKQFVEDPFKGWCKSFHIKQLFTSVAHPQENSQVERMNRSIVEWCKSFHKIGTLWEELAGGASQCVMGHKNNRKNKQR
ncbi:hypothetical protein L1987_02512 [Smallanthus sonchifolius]|uniref:Uncharacterized protein n=1 Tax=Smallanthus sonchifolius TaxID=185202 RepID=A0ACB9K812_9ASTR|nr:hypothetical protein L1987_02512 [Smallanthus sonchifolius]